MARLPLSLAVALVALAAVFTVLWVAVAPPSPSSPSPLPAGARGRELAPGDAVQGELRSGEAASFLIRLSPGDYLHLVVNQQGVDVVAILFDPAQREVLRADGPTGAEGPEPVHAVARAEGRHRLEVRSLARGGSGGYRVRIADLRPATEGDRVRADAAAAFALGERQRSRGSEGLRRALAAYRAALRRWRSLGDLPAEAMALRRIGQVSASLGEPRTALASYEQALSRVRDLGDRKNEPRLLNEIGAMHRRLDDSAAAESAYEQALRLAREAGDRREEAAALNNLGVLYDSLSQPGRALVVYEQALEAWRVVEDRGREAATLHNLGTQYGLLGRLPEARDLLIRALRLRRAAGDRRGEAASLTAIGWVEELAGDLRRAPALYRESIRLHRELGDPRGEAHALSRRGSALVKRGRPREALACYRKGLEILRRIGDRAGEAYLLASIGWLESSRGDPEGALVHLDQALRTFEQSGDRHGEAHVLLESARAERRRGDLRKSLARIERALDIVESLRGETWSEPLKAAYLASRHDYYELCIDLLMELHEREPGRGFGARAFEVSERARARTLLETLSEARPTAEAEPGRRERLRTLEARIRAVETARMELAGKASAPQRLAAIERELRGLFVERELLQAGSRRGGGALDAAPATLREIQSQLLDPGTLLLEYALGDERSFLWRVTPTSVTAHVLPGRAAIEAQALQVYGLLAKSRKRGVERQASLVAGAVSGLLLGPVAGRLGAQRLLIVADGALQYIPFAALPSPGTGEPLLLRHDVVLLPSASVMVRLRQRLAGRRPAPHLLAVVADPVFASDDARVTRGGGVVAPARTAAVGGLERAAVDLGLNGFPRLPYSRREAEAILRLVPAEESLRALDFTASRETVLGGRLGRYRIVHFATHGLLHPQHPELSGVVLAMVDAQGRPRDGFLRAQEIRNLRLPADLVVLSACRTALGKEVRGEGLMGLPRSFLDAGAARVLVSLWGVDDEAAAALMDRFYRGMLREGLPPSQALRAAQLSLLRQPRWRAPYYWAGFTLQGEWR
ncbi:MAG TPA: CHAT domain-containing tetratricopeptide repeat protein [Thermoanaerobaculia bacterium]